MIGTLVNLISSKINNKDREVKILAVLEHMFHGSCRKTYKVLSTAFEPISQQFMN